MEKIIVNYLGREKRYAILKEQKVEKLYIEQPKQQSLVGNIYIGTVTKVMPGLHAAFVDIGEEKQGFLHRDKLVSFLSSKDEKNVKERKGIGAFVHQGERLFVQVEKDATGDKGPRLTGIIELNGKNIVYLPNGYYVAVSRKIEDAQQRESWRQMGHELKEDHEGLIFRTSCTDANREEIRAELHQLRIQYHELTKSLKMVKKPMIVHESEHFIKELKEELKKMDSATIVIDDSSLKEKILAGSNGQACNIIYHHDKQNIFSAYGIEESVEKALRRVVWLSNGAYVVIDETEALTIIDVNTGKYSGKNHLQDTVVKTNELAAEEIARQLRIRDIGGIILIDFIDMKDPSDQEMVQKRLERALQKDHKRTNIVGFTQLGIMQLTRKKTKIALSEGLTEKCKVCDGTGSVLSAETVAFKLERELWELRGTDYVAVTIETTDEVKSVFCGMEGKHLQRMEELIHVTLQFVIKTNDKPFYKITKLI
ncbi:Rne/Rng family ribonuclease [Robertmurraya korlensis]|uniref:Rne/Rng family ribonuclease n=1 Tax=Robertmurraya korlensis TaxID=519977 RepID=UPI0018DDFF71|nr:Rne/Rng family ribonuclease [Robertmurraya korlensis]